jgi:hypothetical protein
MPEKEWDVFISHASEDEEKVARPLADALHRAGVKVWLDQQELELGDSLSEKIDEGLSKSYFGIVILSKSFFSKHWPRRELAGLRSREEDGRKVIFPIWHGINKAEVREFSPILSDALAATTASGIEKLAAQVVRAVFSPSSGSPSAKAPPSLSRVMSTIMEGDSDRHVMVDFVRTADSIVNMYHLFGPHERFFDEKVGNVTFDIVGLYTGHGVTYNFSLLTRFWKDPFIHGMREPHVLDDIRSVLTEVLASKCLFEDQWRELHSRLLVRARDRNSLYKGEDKDRWFNEFLESKPRQCDFRVFCGRRAAIDRTDAHTAAWGRLREEYSDINIHSYDAVLDAILEHEGRRKAN